MDYTFIIFNLHGLFHERAFYIVNILLFIDQF